MCLERNWWRDWETRAVRELATRDEGSADPEPPAGRLDAGPREDPEPERDAVPAGIEA